jgi:hypothetical protein
MIWINWRFGRDGLIQVFGSWFLDFEFFLLRGE